MPAFTLTNLELGYDTLWASMEINPSKIDAIEQKVDKIVQNKFRYEELQKITNVPWYVIGLLHLRESDCNFNTHLHNGDPLTAKTKHVPAGHPRTGTPPFSFEYSAIDALKIMGYTKIKNWSLAQIAYRFEQYNGFGYRGKKVNSPYLWAGTNHYIKGKYVRDRIYNPNHVDQQLGAMAVLKVLLEKTNTNLQAEVVSVPQVETPISPDATSERPTNKELRKTSKKFNIIEWWQWITGLAGGGTAAVKTLDNTNISATKNFVDTLKAFMMDYGVVLVIIILALAWITISYVKKWQKDDIEEGRYVPSGSEEDAS